MEFCGTSEVLNSAGLVIPAVLVLIQLIVVHAILPSCLVLLLVSYFHLLVSIGFVLVVVNADIPDVAGASILYLLIFVDE